MTEPSSTARPPTQSDHVLRVRSGGPAVAIAAVSSLALVGIAVFGFSGSGPAAGRVRIVVDDPGQVQAVGIPSVTSSPAAQVPLIASDAPDPRDGSGGGSSTGSLPLSGTDGPQADPGSLPTGQPTGPTSEPPSGPVSPPPPPPPPDPTGRPTTTPVPPQPPSSLELNFADAEVDGAKRKFVWATVRRIESSTPRTQSGKSDHPGPVVSRALRRGLDDSVRLAMKQAAEATFDAAADLKRSGGTDSEVTELVEVRFPTQLEVAFTDLVCPKAQMILEQVVPQIAGTTRVREAMRQAVPVATTKVAADTHDEVVTAVMSRVNENQALAPAESRTETAPESVPEPSTESPDQSPADSLVVP